MHRHLDRRLKIAHLRIIDALVRHGSLLKAAAPLGVSQPALSRTLHEAEALLGQKLFERLPRGVQPTAIGRVVAGTAARMLAELKRLEDELDQLDAGVAGTVTIGTLPVAASGVLPGAVKQLRASSPGVQIRLEQGRTEELLPRLVAGAIDVVVGRLYVPLLPDGLHRESLWHEPIAVLARARHPLLEGGPATADELRRYEFMLPTIDQRLGQEIEHALDLLGLAARASMRSSSPGFIREMLLDSDMLSVAPQLLMAGDLLRGAVRVVPVPVEMPQRRAGIVVARDRPLSGAAEAFVVALRRHVASLAAAGLTMPVGEGGEEDGQAAMQGASPA